MLSKVLVKFAGIVLITDESVMDVTTPAGDEEVSEQPCEVQESSEKNTKSQTVTAEEAAAENNGRLKLIKLHVKVLLYFTDVNWWCCRL